MISDYIIDVINDQIDDGFSVFYFSDDDQLFVSSKIDMGSCDFNKLVIKDHITKNGLITLLKFLKNVEVNKI